MKYYIPKLQLGVLSTTPQTTIEDKFGGLPWGLPSGSWPVCRSCNKTMSLIAQLNHHTERLNLGRSGRSLFIFMCSNPYSGCEWTWDSAEGCNSSFVIEPESLETGITYPPDVAEPDMAEVRFWRNSTHDQERGPYDTIWIETEVRVLGWLERDDNIPESATRDFMSDSRYGSIDREIIKGVYCGTKLGSVPSWVQWPEISGSDFVGQFADYFGFHTPLPDPDVVGCSVGEGDRKNYHLSHPKTQRFDVPKEVVGNSNRSSEDDPVWFCGGPNFGDAGMGYVFLKFSGELPPVCEFIWQCH